MSTLTKSEKQALNELFITLKERKNFLYRVKNLKKELVLISKYIIKTKKAKHPLV